MSMCKREKVLITTNDVCFDNMGAAAESLFNNHLVALFMGALLLIGLCNLLANRSRRASPMRDDNINYQLQGINNRLDRMGR